MVEVIVFIDRLGEDAALRQVSGRCPSCTPSEAALTPLLDVSLEGFGPKNVHDRVDPGEVLQ